MSYEVTIGVSPKKRASETFGIDVIFCTARCSVVLQPRIVLKVSSYSQENSFPGHFKSLYMTFILIYFRPIEVLSYLSRTQSLTNVETIMNRLHNKGNRIPVVPELLPWSSAMIIQCGLVLLDQMAGVLPIKGMISLWTLPMIGLGKQGGIGSSEPNICHHCWRQLCDLTLPYGGWGQECYIRTVIAFVQRPTPTFQ